MRVKPVDFQRLNLRCHALLSDVPLHDVWAIPLHGGGSVAASRTRAILFNDRRHLISRFEDYSRCARPWAERSDWDDERHNPSSVSYVNRLAEADRSQSQVAPGTREGRFRVLYVLGEEALSEFRNATRACLRGARSHAKTRAIHALLSSLREA